MGGGAAQQRKLSQMCPPPTHPIFCPAILSQNIPLEKYKYYPRFSGLALGRYKTPMKVQIRKKFTLARKLECKYYCLKCTQKGSIMCTKPHVTR